jgi:CRP-like cAMP-binding protein
MGKQTNTRNRALYERCFFAAGSRIFSEGEQADCAYLVQSGAVRVFTESEGKKVELAKLGTGQIVGEMALMCDGCRNASVEAAHHSTLVLITRDVFTTKLNECDQMIKAIMQMLATRVVDSNDNIRNNVRNLEETLYANINQILESLPEQDKDSFRADVLPQISNLLTTLEVYKKRDDTS